MLPQLAARLFGTPLLIQQAKLDLILTLLAPRWAARDPLFSPPASTAPLPGGPPGIALIPIQGTLVRRCLGMHAESGLLSYAAIGQMIASAIADPKIDGLLLEIDSPGGEVGGVFDLAETIRAASRVKPVWALANEMAFSAAYALAAACSRIYLPCTGGVGSIGVIAMHIDQSGQDAQAGLRYTPVFAGAHKNDLSPHGPPSDTALAGLQAEVDRVYGLLIASVAGHRGLDPALLRASEAGLFFAEAAIAAGLADEIGNLDEALAALARHLALRSLSPPTQHTQLLPSPESAMQDHLEPDALPAAPAPPAMAAAGTLESIPIDDAAEIVQLCQLAGHGELAAGFLQSRLAPAAVRQQLLSLAAQSPEIISRIAPLAQSSADNPLLQAIQQRLKTERAVGH